MPHTKSDIIDLLNRYGLAPRHQFGQNFLIDLNLMTLLADTAGLQGNEVILEVGHGTGSMTDLLAERAGAVIAVDIDKGLSQVAQETLSHHQNIDFFCCDILAAKNRIQPEILNRIQQLRHKLGGPFYLIANLPYSISSPLLVNLVLLAQPPEGMWITVQLEVGKRIVASPAEGKIYGSLAIMLQAAGQTTLLRTLPPQAFWPQPQVHSAMVQWKQAPKLPEARTMRALKNTLDTLLLHRRKSISHLIGKHPRKNEILTVLQDMDINPSARAETLPPCQFLKLAESGLF